MISKFMMYKLEIFKLFYNANNDILPDCLSNKNIFRKRETSIFLITWSGCSCDSEMEQQIYERLISLSWVSCSISGSQLHPDYVMRKNFLARDTRSNKLHEASAQHTTQRAKWRNSSY